MRRYADRRDTNEPELKKYLERCGCIVEQISQRSIPDLMVTGGVFGPLFVLFEVKADDGNLTSYQKTFFKKHGNSFCYVVRSIKDIKNVMRLFMPVYIYKCDTCGVFEKKQSFSDSPLDKCPTCGTIVTKLFNVPQIIFKGNGWGGKEDQK